MPRIALIHATPLAVAPVADAFARHWPECDLVNILDDSLSRDAASHASAPHASGDALAARIGALADYALACGADGILYTCSAFGPAIEAVAARLSLPVLKPNEAMLEEALDCVAGRGGAVGIVASFEATLPSMAAELHALAALRGRAVEVRTGLAAGAMAALGAGDAAAHDAGVAAAARGLQGCAVVLLAQFSTARARDAVAAAVPAAAVLTSPDSAVRKMRAALP